MNRFLKGAFATSAAVLLGAVVSLPNGIASGALERKGPRRVKLDELFNQNCARCHGADGRSDTPPGHLFKAPDFTDAEWWKKNASLTSTRTLRSVVARGRGAMPGFGKKLTKSEINLLVNRVRSFRSK
ncbi:MAG: c-type cytochrome [Pyrinomonadaceae bacterium]